MNRDPLLKWRMNRFIHSFQRDLSNEKVLEQRNKFIPSKMSASGSPTTSAVSLFFSLDGSIWSFPRSLESPLVQHRQFRTRSTGLGRIGAETPETEQTDPCQTTDERLHGLGPSCSQESDHQSLRREQRAIEQNVGKIVEVRNKNLRIFEITDTFLFDLDRCLPINVDPSSRKRNAFVNNTNATIRNTVTNRSERPRVKMRGTIRIPRRTRANRPRLPHRSPSTISVVRAMFIRQWHRRPAHHWTRNNQHVHRPSYRRLIQFKRLHRQRSISRKTIITISVVKRRKIIRWPRLTTRLRSMNKNTNDRWINSTLIQLLYPRTSNLSIRVSSSSVDRSKGDMRFCSFRPVQRLLSAVSGWAFDCGL